MTMDAKSWGYRRNMHADDVIGAKALLVLLTRTVGLCGALVGMLSR